jgi:hypothetical protein
MMEKNMVLYIVMMDVEPDPKEFNKWYIESTCGTSGPGGPFWRRYS